jgi:competence protein ComEA
MNRLPSAPQAGPESDGNDESQAAPQPAPLKAKILSFMPYFSRSQLGVALLLGAALLTLWAWRANFGRALAPPPAQNLAMVFVEVRGGAAHPGIHGFSHPPTLSDVWRVAGIPGSPPQNQVKLTSGSRVEVIPEGGYTLGRMSGPQLLTLGLALDLNQATLEELDALPGIGPALAQRIMDFRQAHGPFRQIDDLDQVSGIGPKKMEKIRSYLIIGNN